MSAAFQGVSQVQVFGWGISVAAATGKYSGGVWISFRPAFANMSPVTCNVMTEGYDDSKIIDRVDLIAWKLAEESKNNLEFLNPTSGEDLKF